MASIGAAAAAAIAAQEQGLSHRGQALAHFGVQLLAHVHQDALAHAFVDHGLNLLLGQHGVGRAQRSVDLVAVLAMEQAQEIDAQRWRLHPRAHGPQHHALRGHRFLILFVDVLQLPAVHRVVAIAQAQRIQDGVAAVVALPNSGKFQGLYPFEVHALHPCCSRTCVMAFPLSFVPLIALLLGQWLF
jgi:hypothetical protein